MSLAEHESDTTLTNNDLISILEPSAPAEREIDCDPDGWLFDVATGEIVGHAEADERFEVTTAERAEWVLRIRSDIEGEIAGNTIQEQALLSNLRAKRAMLVRKLSWWDWMFGPSLVVFARSLLAGKKTKTAQFSWGAVSFRKTAGTNQILDMEAAVAWMRIWAPDKVKVKEHVTVGDVLKIRAAVADESGEEPEHLGWLGSTEPGENVKISTGIDVKVEPKE